MKISVRQWFMVGICLLMIAARPYRLYASESARSLFKQGQSDEARKDYEDAFDAYRKAMLDRPDNLRYKIACERTRILASTDHVKRGNELEHKGETSGAMTEFIRATDIDPSNVVAYQAIASLEEHMGPAANKSNTPALAGDQAKLTTIAGPVELKPLSVEPITISMVADSKIVYETLGKIAGLNVLFDPDYTSKRIAVDLHDTGLMDALRIIAATSNTFWKPLTQNAIFVAADTRQKRTELEQQAVQMFYLKNITQANDLNEVLNAVRNLMDTTVKMQAIPSQNAIVMRGTPDQLLLAHYIIDDLDKSKPEVVLDVSILEVDRDKLRNIGLQLPGSISAQLATASTATGATLTLNDLANLTAKNFQLTVSAATANMLLTDNSTRILQKPRLRVTDGQKATIKIGSKIPVATGSMNTGVPTGTGSGISPLVSTQFSYIDVGVNVEMQPTIHYDNDVTIKLKIDVSAENGSTNFGISGGLTEPILSQREVEQTIRLKEGESNILGGILQNNDTVSVNGTPGLGEVPILKYLFSSQSHEVNHQEVVFLITPHVVRGRQIDPSNLRQIDTGTSGAIELRQIQAPVGEPPSKIAEKPVKEH
ncbi:MAG: type II and III secretion system protein [Acidobacteriaceae bacterium]